VQCKQWRSMKIGVKVVREMYGLLTSKSAHGAIIITSGMFTQEAKSFATDKPIDLVETKFWGCSKFPNCKGLLPVKDGS